MNSNRVFCGSYPAGLGFVLAATLMLGGCKALIPYESKFMCEKSSDFGRCMDVRSAYDDALANETSAAKHPDSKTKKDQEWRYLGSKAPKSGVPLKRLRTRSMTVATGTREAPTPLSAMSGADLYREVEYRELAALIEKPVTPIVRPPQVLRTLIVSYTASDSLYMPRYVFYLAEPARFVIGDYLNPVDSRPTVYPNGGAAASR